MYRLNSVLNNVISVLRRNEKQTSTSKYNESFKENLTFNIHPLKLIENSIKRSLNSKKLCSSQVCFPVELE